MISGKRLLLLMILSAGLILTSLAGVSEPNEGTGAPKATGKEIDKPRLFASGKNSGLTIRGIGLGDKVSILSAKLPQGVTMKTEKLGSKRRIVLRDSSGGVSLVAASKDGVERVESISVRPITKYASVELSGKLLFSGDDTYTTVGKISGARHYVGGYKFVHGSSYVVAEFVGADLSGLVLRYSGK